MQTAIDIQEIVENFRSNESISFSLSLDVAVKYGRCSEKS